MVYDRVGDGDKFSYESFDCEGLVFMLPVTGRVKNFETEEFFL